MQSTGVLVIAVVGALAAASPAVAQDNAAAEAAIADLKAKGATEEVVCEVTPDWVTCTGVKTGICLAAGWQISHDAAVCRKRIG